MNQQSVLIIAEQAAHARDIMSHWQMERVLPAFTVMSTEFWESARGSAVDAAILVGVNEPRLSTIVRGLEFTGAPVICAVQDAATVQSLRANFRVLALQQHDGWIDAVVVLATEVLRRVEATSRAKRAEAASQASMAQAALGRYMLDTRHGFNNALTSVLGNAELLMLEPEGSVPEPVREQIDTIHSMALRLHEMMQRFSSLETEMNFSRKASHPENGLKSQAYVSGS